jgi:PAS domain S-box-containing protein
LDHTGRGQPEVQEREVSTPLEPAHSIAVLCKLLDQSTLPIAIADWQGRITVFNAATERLTGYRAAEVLGEPASMFYESPAVTEEIRIRVVEDGKLEDFETVLLGKGGRRIPIRLMATRLQDESGAPFGMMALMVDLTERKGLEDALRLAVRQAGFSNDLMRHDIRNYAQTIGGYLETLLAGQVGALRPEQARVLKVCRRQAQRIEGTIDNLQVLLRAYERCQSGDGPTLQPLDLAPAVEDAFRRVRDLYAERHVVIHRALPEGCAVLACSHFQRVLDNLFVNAVGHNPAAEPRIWVTADPAQVDGSPGWAVGVADNGPGIGPECRARLLDTARPFEPGDSGVGLWVIKALLHNCGGALHCEDRVAGAPDQGTRFIARLRASGAPDPAALGAQELTP